MKGKEKKAKANPAALKAERAKKRLLRAASREGDVLLIQYDNAPGGFDEEKVEEMRDEYGANALTRQKKDSLLKRFLGSFINPFTVVLLVLAGIAVVSKDYPAALIVFSMVSVSGLLRFVQEFRSGSAAERLSEMVETTACAARRFAEREGGGEAAEKREIPLDEIVVGDLVYLAAGDMVPADVRILQAKDLFVSQSALTGESEPVEKIPQAIPGANAKANPLDFNNLAFMGTNVVSGSASALVVAVGDDTILGSVARQLQAKAPPTSFERGVRSVSWVLIRFMMAMAPVVLLVNGFTKGDWFEAFLFALSVAVGLTPEMLPMIVSANLAKGAVSMSKKRVIVKDLNSIQNFGAMDVLCADKTGTLTQDKVILEYHLDIRGEDDPEVLRYAFLNSYYQTGLKNLMDFSIIERAGREEFADCWRNYKKIDEIPFDFSRRRMSVAVEDEAGRIQLITKGAVEEMLGVSSFAGYRGETAPLTPALREAILADCRKYNGDGMRVLGLARKPASGSAGAFSAGDERDMVFIGYLAFLDPPKDSAGRAVAALREYGVKMKVLTGDNGAVTRSVCKSVGLGAEKVLLGAELEAMDDDALAKAAEEVDIFAKLTPGQKARIVGALRKSGHTVGFMGDGINDAAAMKTADVGISVDTAVDIAKESANIILLEKDLMALEEGVVEGRKIYANIIKYVKMAASSNFGNMLSVLAASAFLPFLPMLPIQILILNLIYDISCIAIPWDNVDAEYLRKPRKWDAFSISRFMLWMGPTSSVFDIAAYCLLFFHICPLFAGGPFFGLDAEGRALFATLFHTGWFVESLWSQTLVIHMIRTPKIPFIQSRSSIQLFLLTTLGILTGTAIPYTFLGTQLDMAPLPFFCVPYLGGVILAYMLLATIMKKVFVRRYGELL